jgi:hypothetical protein
MIRLSLPKEPYWLSLPHGVRVFVRPLTTPVYEAARTSGYRLAGELVKEHAEISMVGGTVEGLPDISDADAVSGLSQFLFTKALAVRAIMKWEGVVDNAGNPAEVTGQTVSDLMLIHDMAEAFLSEYTKIHAGLLSEGNASGLSPNGISEEGQNIAQGAETTGFHVQKDSPE